LGYEVKSLEEERKELERRDCRFCKEWKTSATKNVIEKAWVAILGVRREETAAEKREREEVLGQGEAEGELNTFVRNKMSGEWRLEAKGDVQDKVDEEKGLERGEISDIGEEGRSIANEEGLMGASGGMSVREGKQRLEEVEQRAKKEPKRVRFAIE